MYILRLRARILSVVLASLCILGGCSSIQEGAQMHVSSGYFFQAESSSISITGSSVPGGSVSSTPRENDQVLETKEILNKASVKPYKALLSKTYDEKELLAFFKYRQSDNFNTMLQDANRAFPVECFRTVEGSCPYSLYKTKQDGLVYVFYKSGSGLQFASYVFYVKRPLRKEDFQNIGPGDTLKDVEKVDPRMEAVNRINADYLRYPEQKMSLHLVKGGLMQIVYKTDSENLSDYHVDSIRWVPQGEELIVPGGWDPEGTEKQKFILLEQDVVN